jgi:hypothetical protein
MDANRLKALALHWGPGLLAGLAIGALAVFLLLPGGAVRPADPDARRIAEAALISIREQGRLAAYDARYVAVVSASQTSMGLEARKTLILPARVRYSVDLRRLRRENLAWDEATRTLSVSLPPLDISGPEIDLEQAREHEEGGVLMALTGAEAALDEENRRRAHEELLRQARAAGPIGAAREAAMRIVARGFAVPLRAGGIPASVVVRFSNPSGEEIAVHLDRPSRVEDALEERRANSGNVL